MTKAEFDQLKKLYCLDGCSIEMCASALGLSFFTTRKNLIDAGVLRSRSQACKLAFSKGRIQLQHLKGPKNLNWRGGRHKSGQYIRIYAPDHPRANRGYVYEHILVWEQVHNKPLPKGWVVHHLNGIKLDNRPRNLLGMPQTKHHVEILNQALKQRIRELEAEVKLLEKTMEHSQLIVRVSDN